VFGYAGRTPAVTGVLRTSRAAYSTSVVNPRVPCTRARVYLWTTEANADPVRQRRVKTFGASHQKQP